MRWWVTFYDDTQALLGGVIVTEDSEGEALASSEAFYPAGTATAVTDQTSADYPIADDTFKDDTEVTSLHNGIGSPRITVVPRSGDLLQRRVTGLTAVNNNASTDFPAAPNTFIGVVGAGTEIDGGDDTIVNILEPGVYSLRARVAVRSQDAEALSRAEAGFIISGTIDGEGLDGIAGGITQLATNPEWAGFLPAGATIQVWGYAETTSGLWDFNTTDLTIQQVA